MCMYVYMSVLPEYLNACRYSATIMSNVSVFVVMFVLLDTLGHSTGDEVVPGDVWIFSVSSSETNSYSSVCM